MSGRWEGEEWDEWDAKRMGSVLVCEVCMGCVLAYKKCMSGILVCESCMGCMDDGV